jgi:quercetin dioxygenase-like cupin family protein
VIRTRSARTLVAAAATAAVTVACSPTAEPSAGRASPTSAHEDRPQESLEPLLEQALPGVSGKTFTSAIVAFPPDARAVPHRHGDAFVYAYVLDGSVRSRLAGEAAQIYHRGDDWVEQPGADHLLTENTSSSEPARLLVVFVSETGAPLKVDDSRHEASDHGSG